MLLLCREAFAPTKGGGGARCGGMTGGVEEPDAIRGRERERKKKGPNEGGEERKR